ncbi:hypothetical protein COY90_01110 [Candidatus Roizmanbacteria bacterium CG_4_10_14_0_8_um_filter_39_9]|uniref:HAD family phosphatase n=1 Tax=Candidatus Roizmanbacteria bacterium CG_4_10_14_0_8_um_filter_39_9 TaxID=1974829 RepID=A0A2M7QEQ9_9BACT|nr:MAG: hypothetical protein COY90_01110 [Candidatus Roizmanbacteria bacterium CG_4_10_14_0_8_um_filter_39_9]
MINFKVEGAIFDIDDTLLDNKSSNPETALHERARLVAVHEIGKRHSIQKLIELSIQDNSNAFLNAPVHTLEAAVWEIFLMTGVADSRAINSTHPLLKEIVTIKDKLYKDILLHEGEEVPGAVAFVRALAISGVDKLAIASTAIRRDIDIFLMKTGLKPLFPEYRIKSKESTTHPKPNPEIFNIAFISLNILEQMRGQVCAFEDDPRGVMAAKSAGLFTCAITTRFSKDFLLSREAPPDLVAESFQEFAEYFDIKDAFNSFNKPEIGSNYRANRDASGL